MFISEPPGELLRTTHTWASPQAHRKKGLQGQGPSRRIFNMIWSPSCAWSGQGQTSRSTGRREPRPCSSILSSPQSHPSRHSGKGSVLCLLFLPLPRLCPSHCISASISVSLLSLSLWLPPALWLALWLWFQVHSYGTMSYHEGKTPNSGFDAGDEGRNSTCLLACWPSGQLA